MSIRHCNLKDILQSQISFSRSRYVYKLQFHAAYASNKSFSVIKTKQLTSIFSFSTSLRVSLCCRCSRSSSASLLLASSLCSSSSAAMSSSFALDATVAAGAGQVDGAAPDWCRLFSFSMASARWFSSLSFRDLTWKLTLRLRGLRVL